MEEVVTCVDKIRRHIAKVAYDREIDSLKFADELIHYTGYGFTTGNLRVLCNYGLGNLACKAMDLIIRRRVDLNRRLRKDEIEYIINMVIDSASPEDKNKFNELEEYIRKTIEIS